MAKKSEPTVIGVAAAAKVLQVTPRQVRNLIADKLLPAEKVGRDYIIQRADLENVPVRKPGPKAKTITK